MNSTPLGFSMPLKIKTLSPVHIGGGGSLSPLADYVLDTGENIQYINIEKLAEAIDSTGNTEKYIKSVVETATENKRSILKDFCWQTLERHVTEFYDETKIKSFGINNPVLIDCCIKTNGLPYIPGSSLKGALRTCLLYKWLTSGAAESAKSLDDFLDTVFAMKERTDLNVRKKLNEISKSYEKKIDEAVFGQIRQREKLAASCIQVTDSNSTSLENLAAYHLKRVSLLRGSEEVDIPIIKECIAPGSIFNTTLKFDFSTSGRLPTVIKDFQNSDNVFIAFNKFAYDVLEYEDSLSKNKFVKTNKLAGYFNQTSSLKQELENNFKSKGFLRLGFGKLQFYQTIALALFKHLGSDEENEDWIEYLSYCNGDLSKSIPRIYPETRLVTTIGQQTLGWVELY